jgi:regulator of PEP synthase PpsR (kinase-PPPase family)
MVGDGVPKKLRRATEESVASAFKRLHKPRGADKISRSFYCDPKVYRQFQKICQDYEVKYTNVIELLVTLFVETATSKNESEKEG